MARCLGRSGPVEDVVRAARALGLPADGDDLAAVDALGRRLADELATHRADAERAVAVEIASLERIVADGDPSDAEESARAAARTEQALAEIETEIRRLDARRGFLRRLLAALRRHVLQNRADGWRGWRDAQIARVGARGQQRRQRLERLRANAASEVAHRVRAFEIRLAGWREIAASPAMVGARGESDVAEELHRLPDGFCVLHHLQLRAGSFVRHLGKPVLSAEVDHVVVGPTGVWVVETKCWSARFVREAEYLSPYVQADRAGLLCWVLLKEAGLPARVRQLVVPFAELPPRPEDAHARAVPPRRLRACIEQSRRELSSDAVRATADFLWTRFGNSTA